MKKIFLFLFVSFYLFGFEDSSLKIGIDDVYVEAHEEGFHLFIKKKTCNQISNIDRVFWNSW